MSCEEYEYNKEYYYFPYINELHKGKAYFSQDINVLAYAEWRDFEEYLRWCEIEDEIKYQKEKEEYLERSLEYE